MSTPSPVASEIVRQVQAMLPLTRSMEGVKFLHSDTNENWIRVHLPKLRRNVDIELVPGVDLYEVKVHDFVNAVDFETRAFDRVYCDDLGKMMAMPRPGKTNDLFIPEPFQATAVVTDWEW